MADKPKSQGPGLPPNGDRLTRAAQAGDMHAAGIDKPAEPRSGPDSAGKLAMQAMAVARQDPPCATCKIVLKIAIFFDGTGNNLDADVPTQEHSNVARLYRAHVLDDIPRGIHSRYVPGLGTYFKDIGDPGDDEGMAFARHGDERLDWAMKEIDNVIARYVPANITALRFSLFGFSRGAALARAFAVRLQKRVESAGGAWRWKGLGCPAEIYFLGIFDTVASVGLPASSKRRSCRPWWPSSTSRLTRACECAARVPATGSGQLKMVNCGPALPLVGKRVPTPRPDRSMGTWDGAASCACRPCC